MTETLEDLKKDKQKLESEILEMIFKFQEKYRVEINRISACDEYCLSDDWNRIGRIKIDVKI